jgi:CubicO group peptidase (beta-lactamase class C family)
MSNTKRLFALLGILILLGTQLAVSPAMVSSAQSLPLQQVDQDKIDAYIQSRMQAANIPGLALGVVVGDEVVYVKGYGVAGPDGRPVTPQTPFILGSTSKSFTALAVMQLVEAGKIELDASVTTYLPWFHTNDAAASAQITVRNLLNQNSGLPAYEGLQGIAYNDQSDMALENGIRTLAGVQLSHPAGQSYEYSNVNYNILGMIVQAVSGNSYEDYIRSAIFAPLQMIHSAAALSDLAAINIATGYRYWFLWPVAFDAPYPRHMTPSGFLISSAEDITHYLIAQLNGGAYAHNQLLSPQGIATLHAPGTRIGLSSSYGMGWVVQGHPGSTRVWHNGDVSNFHSNLLLLPDQKIGIVVLVNVGGFLNGTTINIPIEGVAAILLGDNITESTNPPVNVIPQGILLVVLLAPALWITGSYLSIKRWQHRQQLLLHGIGRFWRLYLPLAVDVLPLGIVWILLPAQFHAPMETIALFAPDASFVIAILTGLTICWVISRIFLTLSPNRLVIASGRHAENESRLVQL